MAANSSFSLADVVKSMTTKLNQLQKDLPTLDPLGTDDSDDICASAPLQTLSKSAAFPSSMTAPTNGNGSLATGGCNGAANGAAPKDGSEVAAITSILPLLRTFGYTRETLELLMALMASTGVEGFHHLSDDATLPVLPHQYKVLPEYFKQHCAQLTNSAIDPREGVGASLRMFVGPEGELGKVSQENSMELSQPILSVQQMAALKRMDFRGWRTNVIDTTFDKLLGDQGIQKTLKRICKECKSSISWGHQILVFSDRGISSDNVPVSPLLVVGAVHNHLVHRGLRSRSALVVDSGEPWEVHHFCTLLRYGADAVCPYLAFESLRALQIDRKLSPGGTFDEVEGNYIQAVGDGILKVMAKMGMSTLQSYKGAQVFQALGLGSEVIDLCFPGTTSSVGGVSLSGLSRESVSAHKAAFSTQGELAAGDCRRGESLWNDTEVAAEAQCGAKAQSCSTSSMGSCPIPPSDWTVPSFQMDMPADDEELAGLLHDHHLNVYLPPGDIQVEEHASAAEGTKTCNICGKIDKLDLFLVQKKLQNYCKKCRNLQSLVGHNGHRLQDLKEAIQNGTVENLLITQGPHKKRIKKAQEQVAPEQVLPMDPALAGLDVDDMD